MARHEVVFRKCGPATVADPGTVFAHRGDTITFPKNPNVRVFFPQRELIAEVDPSLLKNGVVSLLKGPFAFRVPKGLGHGRLIYYYSAYSSATHSFAVGGSEPKIIIEP